MEFTVWDIGGPASMATVNQCFFTDKALYVVKRRTHSVEFGGHERRV